MTVEIWRASIEALADRLDSFEKLLSEGERARAARFKVEQPRLVYIVSQGLLRLILAQYQKASPAKLQFEHGPKGKPWLPDGVQFNLSHSADAVIFAVSPERELGIDIEKLRTDVQYEKLARRFFSTPEADRLLALPPGQRVRAFFQCWTRKEAYLKAHGWGISFGLDQFEVSLGPEEAPALLAHQSLPQEVGRWSMQEVDCGVEYVAALVVSGERPELTVRAVDELSG